MYRTYPTAAAPHTLPPHHWDNEATSSNNNINFNVKSDEVTSISIVSSWGPYKRFINWKPFTVVSPHGGSNWARRMEAWQGGRDEGGGLGRPSRWCAVVASAAKGREMTTPRTVRVVTTVEMTIHSKVLEVTRSPPLSSRDCDGASGNHGGDAYRWLENSHNGIYTYIPSNTRQ